MGARMFQRQLMPIGWPAVFDPLDMFSRAADEPSGRDRAQGPIARLGSLSLHLAASSADRRAAQALRYRVFHEEMSARPSLLARLMRRDRDRFDKVCDHLIVRAQDEAAGGQGRAGGARPSPVVGTYRLLGQERARRHGGFYSQSEFDVAALAARHSSLRFLELGRSCVLPQYRTKRTMELLWQGIYAYVHQNGYDVMVGCASFPTTDIDALALPLSYLHHHASAPAPWNAAAHPHRHVSMNRMAAHEIGMKDALRAMPPLIKAYLRLGAMIGDGAVVDHEFGTTDVLVILPLASVGERYLDYFAKSAA